MAFAKVWWTIDCHKHGTHDVKKGIPMEIRRLKVAPPKNKKERFGGGCPRCKQEEIAAMKEPRHE